MSPTIIDPKIFDGLGIAGVVAVLVYFGYMLFKLLIDQWEKSTEAINRNSESYEKLTQSYERLTETMEHISTREQEFQKETIDLLYELRDVSRETNRYTRDLYDHLMPVDSQNQSRPNLAQRRYST